MNPNGLLISLCTYNERGNLGPLVEEIHLHAPEAHVLVVDDGSPDGTGDLADQLATEDSRIHVLHRAKKMGLGTALLAAMNYAMDNDYELLLNMDADFSHHPRHIPALVASADRVDIAVGSRYVPGGRVEGWGWKRKAMSWSINRYARLLLRLTVRDTSGSFRCYRLAKLRELDFSLFKARGYAVLQELLYRGRRIGCQMEEVPIVFKDRQVGESKINWREVAAALGVIARLGAENVFGVRVKKSR